MPEQVISILVNHERLSDAPYYKGNQELFCFNDDKALNQFAHEVVFGTPACMLVSGYRGAGKTSFISKALEQCRVLADGRNVEQLVVVELKIPSHKDYRSLLRKMIRAIYTTLRDAHHLWDSRQEDNAAKEFLTSFERLYLRTFNDVTVLDKSEDKDEDKREEKLVIDIKGMLGDGVKFGLLALSPFAGAAAAALFSFHPWAVFLFVSAVIVVPLWRNLKSLEIGLTTTHTNTKLKEFSTKELYDDEIADVQLERVLRGVASLKHPRLKLVFVLDEVDKIDNTEHLRQLIGDLKPWMLSGLATFVVISGQALYYEFEAASQEDDAILGSIFSRTIHVPLLKLEVFLNIFGRLVADPNVLANERVIQYVHSLVLRSARVPRRFINFLRQDLTWENGNAYLQLKPHKASVYRRDSLLISLVDEIIRQESESRPTPPGILDVYVRHLHLWVEKIKLREHSPFYGSEILPEATVDDGTRSDPSGLPKDVQTSLELLFEKFLARMVTSQLLKKTSPEGDDQDALYEAIMPGDFASVSTGSTSPTTLSPLSVSELLMGFERIEEAATAIVGGSADSIDQGMRGREANVHALRDLDHEYMQWYKRHRIPQLFQVRELIRRSGGDVLNFDVPVTRAKLTAVLNALVEAHLTRVTRVKVSDWGYNLVSEVPFEHGNKTKRADLVAYPPSERYQIVFEIKNYLYGNALRQRDLLRFLDDLEAYNESRGYRNYGVIYWVTYDEPVNYDAILSGLMKTILVEYPHLANYVAICNVTLSSYSIVRRLENVREFILKNRDLILHQEELEDQEEVAERIDEVIEPFEEH